MSKVNWIPIAGLALIAALSGCPSDSVGTEPGRLTCDRAADCPGDWECVGGLCYPRDFPGPYCDTLECGAAATCREGPPPGCFCDEGYTGDGVTCTDVDECAAGTDDCADAATCANSVGGFSCTCVAGYTGDGVTCADVDECLGDPCGANATCTNTIGNFTCECDPGYTGDGVTCADVDECLTGPCGANATCTNVPGTYSCACDEGWFGDGLDCRESIGQVIWMGHDLYSRNDDVDRVIGNAVLQATTLGTVGVVGYDQYADLTAGGEAENTDAAVLARAAALGRTVTITRVSDYLAVPALLATADVLLVYEMENGGDAAAIGTAAAPYLETFLEAGGVVIVMDHVTQGWRILDAARIMRFLGSNTSYGDTPVEVRVPADPLMADVTTPTYTGSDGTASFWTNDGTIVAVDSAGLPVVVHKNYTESRFAGGVAPGAAWEVLATGPEDTYSLMTDGPAHIADIYNMYDSTGQRYSPATNTWTPLVAVGPPANPWFQMAPVGMALYGWVAYTTDVWRYAVASDTWTNRASFAGGGTNEYTMAAADEAGRVYGYASNGNILVYNPQTNAVTTFATSIAALRGTAPLFETRLAYDPPTRSLYLGAYSSPELYAFRLDTLATRQVASIPESQLNDIFCGDRAGHVYAAGGDAGSTMFIYDIATDTWSPIPDLPIDHGNNGSCLVSDDGHLYVGVGGGGDLLRIPLAR